ncbi:hypothetical protein DES53_10940 [Roseimicrobium gellanilyticum]|uniref:Uncharacterized protein n=1 Tax=Roseimicrobium gellanilyticum TaxID=748857 RepID=A0A366HBA2_9BACT|nr:hypothetical protein DES53_10940 [Roseimicrobium gellanilyticum]
MLEKSLRNREKYLDPWEGTALLVLHERTYASCESRHPDRTRSVRTTMGADHLATYFPTPASLRA